MKKPDPCVVRIRLAGGEPAGPDRRENGSGGTCRVPPLPELSVCRTRTPITAGFTTSTTSAKPAGVEAGGARGCATATDGPTDDLSCVLIPGCDMRACAARRPTAAPVTAAATNGPLRAVRRGAVLA